MARILACLGLGAWVLLLWPFPVTTVLGMCIACVSYPLYTRWLAPRFGSLALTLYAGALSLAVLLPIAAVISLITPQAVAGVRTLDRFRESGWWTSPKTLEWFATIDGWLKAVPGLEGGLEQLTSSAASLAGSAARTVLAGGMGLAGGAFQLMLELIVFVMIATLCVGNAQGIRAASLRLTAFPEPMLDRFIKTIRGAISAVLMGVVFVAVIQGVLCGVAFAAAGVPQPAFWGLIATFVAPIPFVGTALVWLPACLWLWLTGSTFAAVGLALWCAVVVAGADNVLRPFFLKTGIDASVVTLLLSILCGLAAFGPVGIFVGPVLVAVGIEASRESITFPPQTAGQKPDADAG